MKSKLLQKKLGNNEAAPVKPSLGQELVKGLEEAVKYEKGEVELRTTVVEKEDNTLNLTAYDIIKDPEKNGNYYLAVEIKYNLKTKKTSFIVRPFSDKTAGMSMFMDKENRKYLFEKNRGGK